MIRAGITVMLLFVSCHIGLGQLTLESQQVEASVALEFTVNPVDLNIPPTSGDVMRKEPDVHMLIAKNDAYAYTPKHYGFFCKVESNIEKKSRIAPRFRLGSTSYVDALEGKGQLGPNDR